MYDIRRAILVIIRILAHFKFNSDKSVRSCRRMIIDMHDRDAKYPGIFSEEIRSDAAGQFTKQYHQDISKF